MPTSLIALFSLANLVVGTGAFIISGILPAAAQGLGVGVPAAAQAMTVYALAAALLAQVLLVATGRWPRRRVLVGAMAMFTAGCAVCAVAPSLLVLLAGRAMMGAGAMFLAAAAGIVVALVAPHQRGKALAVVFMGMSLSYLTGLPLGTWLAETQGWRAPLWLVTACAALATLALRWLVPGGVQAPGASLQGIGVVLRQGPVMISLAITALYFAAVFTVFSFIVLVLRALTPMTAGELSLTLMLFGAAGLVGTLSGGYCTDRFGSRVALTSMLTLLASTMLVLPLTGGRPLLMTLVLLLWGAAGFGMMAPQQSRLAELAPAHGALLLSLNSSMLYLGMAVGAALGGLAAPWLGYARLSWVSAALVVVALGLLALERRSPRLRPA
jgi:DHA1 family inner membrane transport protein